MTIWVVSRHPGAVEWLGRRGYAGARRVAHLDPRDVESGDLVVGTLPVHMVARLVRAGAIYYHLVIDIPPGLRGRELSASELDRLGARLERYVAERLPG